MTWYFIAVRSDEKHGEDPDIWIVTRRLHNILKMKITNYLIRFLIHFHNSFKSYHSYKKIHDLELFVLIVSMIILNTIIRCSLISNYGYQNDHYTSNVVKSFEYDAYRFRLIFDMFYDDHDIWYGIRSSPWYVREMWYIVNQIMNIS